MASSSGIATLASFKHSVLHPLKVIHFVFELTMSSVVGFLSRFYFLNLMEKYIQGRKP